jgi:hypothetical protein
MEASAPGGAPLAASQHFTRSKVAGKEFKAAGVLPFTLSGGGREVLCLLGGELVRTGPKGKVQKQMWCALPVCMLSLYCVWDTLAAKQAGSSAARCKRSYRSALRGALVGGVHHDSLLRPPSCLPQADLVTKLADNACRTVWRQQAAGPRVRSTTHEVTRPGRGKPGVSVRAQERLWRQAGGDRRGRGEQREQARLLLRLPSAHGCRHSRGLRQAHAPRDPGSLRRRRWACSATAP